MIKAREWLRRVGLASFVERYPHMLSGGQRKRVALAQMLIRDPEILLMDEPFGPLDAQTRQIMGNLLLDLWAANRKAVARFNRDHPIGTPVRFWPGVRSGEGRPSRTRSQAQILSGHTPVVWVEGYAGCIALTHVEPVEVAS